MVFARAKKITAAEKIKIHRKTITVKRVPNTHAFLCIERSLLRCAPSLAESKFVAALSRVLNELRDQTNKEALLLS